MNTHTNRRSVNAAIVILGYNFEVKTQKVRRVIRRQLNTSVMKKNLAASDSQLIFQGADESFIAYIIPKVRCSINMCARLPNTQPSVIALHV